MAYSEHVGIYRQAGGSKGDNTHLYACKTNRTIFFGTCFTSASSRLCQLMLKRFECLCHFRLQLHKFHVEHGLLRIDHHIHRQRNVPLQANRFPEPPLDSVTVDRAAQHPAHCETHARTLAFCTPQVKHGHVRGKLPASLLVNSLKVRVPQQARTARELAPTCICWFGG